jgi:hypothetical protein
MTVDDRETRVSAERAAPARRRNQRWFRTSCVLAVALAFQLTPPGPAAARQQPAALAEGPVLQTSDVDRFFAVFDAAGGAPTALQLQTDYLDQGSPGLKHFASIRNITGERIASAIAARPGMYLDARRCAATLPAVRRRVGEALDRLAELYPEARFPAATISVGRGRPVAVASASDGINVGLEALCATTFINPDEEDRFVGVLVHEYVHVQQSPLLQDADSLTVLGGAFAEGAAEFVTELLTGDVAYAYLADLVRGRETEIETAFAADMHKTDLSAWLYNSTPEKPADLGYWVGYRIIKTYYDRSPDKVAALRSILQATDAEAFLAESGWRPGG